MRLVVVAAAVTTAMLSASDFSVAQEAQGAQAKQARPRAGAVTRADQPDSSRTASQAERRRPPAPTVVEANSNNDQNNDEGTSDAQRRGAVRRPPSPGSSGSSPSGGSGSTSTGSPDSLDRAVPRGTNPNPPRHVYYPNYRNRYYYDPWGYGAYGLGYFYYSPWGYWPGYWGPGYYGHGPYGGGYDLGGVKLKVKPRDAEVFVDGYYAGTVDDFDGIFQALKLDSGAYKIEIRKPGFETLFFDVRVQPDRTITYRGDMKASP